MERKKHCDFQLVNNLILFNILTACQNQFNQIVSTHTNKKTQCNVFISIHLKAFNHIIINNVYLGIHIKASLNCYAQFVRQFTHSLRSAVQWVYGDASKSIDRNGKGVRRLKAIELIKIYIFITLNYSILAWNQLG